MILWCHAISIGRAQETAEPKEASQTPTPAIEQPSPLLLSEPTPANGQPSSLRPEKYEPTVRVAEPKRIVIHPGVDAQESEVAMQFMADLEKAGIAMISKAEMTLAAGSPVQAELFMREDESFEKIKQLIVVLRHSGVEQMVLEFKGIHPEGRGEQTNGLIFRTSLGFSQDDLQRFEKAARKAAEDCGLSLHFAGTLVAPSEPVAAVTAVKKPDASHAEGYAPFSRPPQPATKSVKVFALRHAQASDAAEILKQVYDKDPLKIVPDARTNSLIVTALETQVLEIEALLMKLDQVGNAEPGKENLENDGNSTGQIIDSVSELQKQVAQLQTDYKTANKQAHDITESLRQAPDAAKKAELRTAVQRAFTLRQSLLRAELQEMQARLEKTQQSLDTRERIADQIVDRRVEDLLNPKLKWDDDKDSIDTTGPMTSTTDALQKPATTAPVTELEGDWHLVSITDKAGDPVEVRPINLSFRNDRYTLVYQGDQIDRRVEVYPDQKEIRYFADGNDSFSRTQYLLISDELTIDGESQKRVYHRGHVRIPRSIPKATDEQKSRWRSGIVDIIAQQANAATSDQKRIGYGVIVSPQMVIVAQLKLSDGDWSFFAKFDDGGIVSIKIVEEGPQGWVTFQPEQSIEVNHHFQLSTSAVGQYDEVNFWGRSAKLSDQPTPELFTTTVTALDRKSPALGLALWQLLSYDKLDGSLPILDDHGNVLAIALIGTGDLFLAVPVSQLKTIFPKSLGQLTDTQTSAELSTAPDSEPAQPFAEN